MDSSYWTSFMQEANIMALVELLLPYMMPIGLILFAMALWRYYVESTRDCTSPLPLPPGTVGLPFIGETFHMILKGFGFYREKREKYGHVYKTHILGKPTIRVWGQENIRKVLKSEETLVTMNWPSSVKAIIGRGSLANSTRRLHNVRRAAILKAFTTPALNAYTQGIEKIIGNYLDSWCGKGKILALPASKQLCTEVTARMLLGCDITKEQMAAIDESMCVMIDNFFTLPIDIPGTGYHKALKARSQLLTVLDDIILKHKGNGLDALSVLKAQVEDGQINMEDLKDSFIEMFVSAYNGLSSLCCSTLVQLAKHPDVTDKLVQELQQANLLDNATLNADSLTALPYMQQVCKELLRFAPPFGGGFRHVLKTFELEGYQIPAGWTLLYSIRDNHEAEENFADASEFDPERWSTGKQSDAFIPFGGNGIRSCIGEKYVTLFAQIFICQAVKRCQWEMADPDTTFTHLPVQQPTNGLPLIMSRSMRKSY